LDFECLAIVGDGFAFAEASQGVNEAAMMVPVVAVRVGESWANMRRWIDGLVD
jgi:hypothetical protein